MKIISIYVCLIMCGSILYSCGNYINVHMKGHVNGFEEWLYGDEYIVIEASNQIKKIPDSLICCSNKFILFGRFNGSKEYLFNYEFMVDRRVYLYDSFTVQKPYKSVGYDTINRIPIYHKFE